MTDILFISRGLGWGHSIRDILISDEMYKIDSNLTINFVSYDAGYNAYKAYSRKCVNLELPSNIIVGEYIYKIANCLLNFRPKLVVSDEELLVLPLCKALSLPCILITNWLPKNKFDEYISLFNKADIILFAEQPDFFEKIKKINIPIIYTGPIYRKCAYNQEQLQNMKKDLNILNNDFIITVTLGGRNDTSAMTSNIFLLENIIEIFLNINLNAKIFLNCGDISKFFKYAGLENQNIKIQNNTSDILKLFAISNLIITRSGINTLWEAASMAIPTITIPYPTNINFYEEYYAQVMKKRGLVIYLSQQDIIQRRLEAIICNVLKLDYREKIKQNLSKLNILQGSEKAAKFIFDYYNTTIH